MNISVASCKEIFKAHYGKALKASNRELSGTYKVYGSSGSVGKHNSFLIDEPTIVIGRKGSVGEIVYAPEGGWIIDTAFFIELIDKEKCDLRYLYYALKNANLSSLTISTSIPGLNRDDLYDTKIFLPPLEEQKRIAATLDKADTMRRKRQQAIDLTDQLLRSVFLELFGDPVTNPKGWKKIALQNVVSEVIDCPHSTPRWTENGKVAIRTSNLTAGGWNWSDKRYVSEEEYHDRSKRSYVEPGDIILSREGTVGIAAIVQEDMEICLGQRLVQLRPNLGIANSEYILHILLYELEPERLERAMVGATSKHLNVKELRELEIPLPLLELQDNFKKTVNKITMYKSRLARAALLDENLFSALTQNAFSGELSQVA